MFHPEEDIGAFGPQMLDIVLKGLNVPTDSWEPAILGDGLALPVSVNIPSFSGRLVAGVPDPQLEVKDTREFHPLLALFVRVLHRLFCNINYFILYLKTNSTPNGSGLYKNDMQLLI